MRAVCIAAPVAVALIGAAPSAPEFTLLTVAQRDRQRTASEPASVSVSADGRHLAFTSYVPLATADTDPFADVYVVDLSTGATTLESVAADGWTIESDCANPRISADGRFVVFEAGLRAPRGTGFADVVFRDRLRDRSVRVSRPWSGDAANGRSANAALSDDGRTVVFQSAATNLVPGGDANGPLPDIYMHDTATGQTRRIAADASGAQSATGHSAWPALSGDGRYLTFVSSAGATVGATGQGDQSRAPPLQLYLRDLVLNVTTRVSTSASGTPANHSSERSAISRDGAYVAFVSQATNLVSGDHNRSPDVFVYARSTGTITLVSRGASGGTANAPSGNPAISADGRFIAFQSHASNLCAGRCGLASEDINLVSDIFLFDRQTASMTRISRGTVDAWMEESAAPVLDGSGSVVAFSSRRPIDARDTAHDFDLFVRVPAAGR